MKETLRLQAEARTSRPATSVIRDLLTERPKFQLRSGVAGLHSSEQHLFGGHAVDTRTFERAAHPIAEGVLEFIADHVQPGDKTVETGGGWSTAVFAASGAKHTCVNPDVTGNGLVAQWLAEHGVSTTSLTFVADSSDLALPAIQAAADHAMALVDGNHSHPFPLLDWHYGDRLLRVGGWMLLDNVEIGAVRHVVDFLRDEPSYRFGFAKWGCAIFEKVSTQRVMGWSAQRMNKVSAWAPRELMLRLRGMAGRVRRKVGL